MMPRRLWTSVFVIAGLVCGGPGQSAAQSQPHWPDTLVLATASPGGTYHAYGAGLARILTGALGLPVLTRDTEGPSENIRLVEAGTAQLGFVTVGAALQAWSGVGNWTGGRQFRAMRAIFPMYDTPFHFVVRLDAPVRTIADLAGKRVGAGPQGGTAADYVPRLFAALSIEAPLSHGTWAELAVQLRTGGLDGLAVAAGVPFPAIAELEARRAIRYIPVPREQAVAMRLAVPELTASVIPAGTYPSLMENYQTVGLYNFAMAHQDLPADLAFEIVKAVFDFHAELVEAHPSAAATVPANFIHNTVLPWHTGALRYYANRAVRGVVAGD
jgi:TRAP transporter TAXI family solute receptor